MVCFTKWPRINILDKVAGVGASYRFNHRKHYKLKPSQSLWRLSSKLKAPRAHCGPCGAVKDPDDWTPPDVQISKKVFNCHSIITHRYHPPLAMAIITIKGGDLEAQLQQNLGEGSQVNRDSFVSSSSLLWACFWFTIEWSLSISSYCLCYL